jgi:hypothetical protein
MVVNNFVTERQVYVAAMFWYGSFSLDACCLAEVRLMKGEKCVN